MQKLPGKIAELQSWEPVESVWKSGQVGLPQVPRWSKYLSDTDGQGGVRRQNSLQHSHSITRLCDIFVYSMRKHAPRFDAYLLHLAVSIHDEGEGEILEDTLYIDKTIDGDLKEYVAFVQRYKVLERGLFFTFQKAFLLQFAIKNPENFPSDARSIMEMLKGVHTFECLAFDAIERWDYVLFAIEQYRALGNEKILVQVLRGQTPKLNFLADEKLKGFGNEIWTPEIRAWCEEFIAQREGLWIEQKGEK